MLPKLSAIATTVAFSLFVPQLAFCDVTNYFQTNLTSDLPGVAANQDPNLANPWGIAFSPSSPFWISDNHTGLSTLYNGAGKPQSLVVTIPPTPGGAPPGAPTGVVFNSTSDFSGNKFIFATEDGGIAGWSGGTAATIEQTVAGAVYKGVTIGNNGGSNLLYAANFNSGNVDVFNSSFSLTTLPGGFVDPNLPAGFAPFDIQNIGGLLYVTYAKQNAEKHDDVAGAGNGFVDVFDTNGNFKARLISQGALDSPWGLALAPGTFGAFANDLLVGNFGDGKINAYNPITGAFLGTLSDSNGNPIVNEGLWGLAFGNGGPGFDLNALYFTAGIPGPDKLEDHGLFGEIQAVPEPSALVPIGAISFALLLRRRHRRQS
jgi:uncharacterized protein (TIGR03118 family)